MWDRGWVLVDKVEKADLGVGCVVVEKAEKAEKAKKAEKADLG